jgi:hypothetical protein
MRQQEALAAACKARSVNEPPESEPTLQITEAMTAWRIGTYGFFIVFFGKMPDRLKDIPPTFSLQGFQVGAPGCNRSRARLPCLAGR